jgi:hypothetical protein
VTTGRAAADEVQRQALLSLCRGLQVGGIKINGNVHTPTEKDAGTEYSPILAQMVVITISDNCRGKHR